VDRSNSAEDERFRAELRTWLAGNLPPGWLAGKRHVPSDPRAVDTFLRDWARRLSAAGWAGMAWPTEYGGRGASLLQQLILEEELARCEAPHFVNFVGTNLVGPTLIALGSPTQRETYLPRIIRGDEIWCQGFSEPDAGSDLAALSTRATREGDEFVIHGQKIWTSFATMADRCFLLARTARGERVHDGITALLVDMRQSGVEVRPIHQINGNRRFNEVYFDAARVSAADVVGKVDHGWSVAMSMLQFERTALAAQVFALRNSVERLSRTARRQASPGGSVEPSVRRAVAGYIVRARAIEALFDRHMSEYLHGSGASPNAVLDKLATTELHKEVAGFGAELVGARMALWEDDADQLVERWRDVWLTSIGYTIAGGTSEILRNVIAERLLGLPRDPRG
jgi:alkylation response protein AidB-like acyl-CoA dehydrogenase